MKDLAGFGVAVTRNEGSDGPLSRRLAARGARVVDWAALRHAPPSDPRPLAAALERLVDYDWLVVTSARAVPALAAATGPPPTLQVAAVGPATAAALEGAGFRVDRIGEGPGAEAMIAAFAAAGDAEGVRVLFPASSEARPVLEQGLGELGAEVDRVEAYRTLPTGLDAERCRRDVAAGRIDAVVFASPSAVGALVASCGREGLVELLSRLAVVSIGPATSAALAELERRPDVEAQPSTFDGVADAVAQALAHPRFRARAAAAGAPVPEGESR